IRVSLRAMLPMLERLLEPRRDAIARLHDRAAAERVARRAAQRERVSTEMGRAVTTPFVACAEVLRAIGPEVAIVDEAASLMPHTRALLDSPSWRQYSSCRGGGLGWGMPAAVGASLGLDRNPVVSLIGDGAAMYSPQALWTAANENLPVTFVVMNNRGYRILKNFMAAQSHYLSVQANRYIAMDLDDPAIDFPALAASMGVPARRVERASDIAAAVEAGIASGRPNLIEIPISAG
ncbi:MAG: thiamine pyrophosphate-binding protein, partial [Gluconacetobacter diazotrophicus]|nr:thiamine pyrophosphate-binding protein [Gluconacetobacter diazotrophicus]